MKILAQERAADKVAMIMTKMDWYNVDATGKGFCICSNKVSARCLCKLISSVGAKWRNSPLKFITGGESIFEIDGTQFKIGRIWSDYTIDPCSELANENAVKKLNDLFKNVQSRWWWAWV